MPPSREGALGLLGRIASTFAGGAPDGARHVWDGFAPWIQQLTQSAATRWMPTLILGIPCEVGERGHPCDGVAVQGCEVCRRPVCIQHAFAASVGAVVCFVCVKKAAEASAPKIPGDKPAGGGAKRSAPPPRPQPPPGPGGAPPPRQKPPPPAEAYAAARRVLGVKRSATAADIDAAYKKLLARWHPDKHPEHLRADANRRFVEVRTAYDFLKDHPE